MFDLKEVVLGHGTSEHGYCTYIRHRNSRTNILIDGDEYAFVFVMETYPLGDRYCMDCNATPSNKVSFNRLLEV